MGTLYNIVGDFVEVYALLSDPEADEQTVLDTLEGIKGELEVKAEGYVKIIRQLEAEQKALEAEAEFFKQKATVRKNNIKRMKELMTLSMQTTGKVKFKTAQNSFWVQKNPESVVVDAKSFADIPEDFLRYKDPEPDKEKMKTAIKAGADLSGIAHIEQTEGVRFR